MIIISRKEKAKRKKIWEYFILLFSSPPFFDGTFKVKKQIQTHSQIGPHKTL